MRNRLTLSILLSLLFLNTGSAIAQVAPEQTSGSLALNFWNPDPEITVQDVDFVGSLGIAKERFKDIHITLGQKHKFRFSYVPVKYGETGKLIATTVTYQGRTYTVDTPVNYEFKWNLYNFGYEWDFARFSHGFVGVIGEVKYSKVTTSLSSPVAGSEATDTKVPVPTVGGIARGYLGDYFSVSGEFTGLKIDRTDFRGKFYDVNLYAQVNLTKNVAAQAGYRSLDVDYLVDNDTGTFKMKGPYFGGVVRF